MASGRPVKEVGGTSEFRQFFDSLQETDPLKQEIRQARDLLKEDCTRGDKIQKSLFPEPYVRKYKITNLWRYPLSSGRRLLYTILSDTDGFRVSIIEAMPHDEYDKRFGY